MGGILANALQLGPGLIGRALRADGLALGGLRPGLGVLP
jgi:hypothetical protein